MNDPKNIAILLLCVTATILGTALFLAHTPSASADVSVSMGDYIMFPGAISDTMDVLNVIDTVDPAKLNVYVLNPSTNAFTLKSQVNLKQLFAK